MRGLAAFVLMFVPAVASAAVRDQRIEDMKGLIGSALGSCDQLDVNRIKDLKVKLGANIVGGAFTSAGGLVATGASLVAVVAGNKGELAGKEDCTKYKEKVCTDKGKEKDCSTPDSAKYEECVKRATTVVSTGSTTTERNARLVSTIGSGVATVAAGASALAYVEIINMMGEIDDVQTNCVIDINSLYDMAKKLKRPDTGCSDGSGRCACGTDAATVGAGPAGGQCSCMAGAYTALQDGNEITTSTGAKQGESGDRLIAWCRAPSASSTACGSLLSLARVYNTGSTSSSNHYMFKESESSTASSAIEICAVKKCDDPATLQPNGDCKCPGPAGLNAYQHYEYDKAVGTTLYHIADIKGVLVPKATQPEGAGKCYGDCGDGYTQADPNDDPSALEVTKGGQCVKIANYDAAYGGCGDIAWPQQEYDDNSVGTDRVGTGRYVCTCPGTSTFMQGKCQGYTDAQCNCSALSGQDYADCVNSTQNNGYNKTKVVAENFIYTSQGGFCVHINKTCGILKTMADGITCNMSQNMANMEQKKGVWQCDKQSVQRADQKGVNYCVPKRDYKTCKKRAKDPTLAPYGYDVRWDGQCVAVEAAITVGAGSANVSTDSSGRCNPGYGKTGNYCEPCLGNAFNDLVTTAACKTCAAPNYVNPANTACSPCNNTTNREYVDGAVCRVCDAGKTYTAAARPTCTAATKTTCETAADAANKLYWDASNQCLECVSPNVYNDAAKTCVAPTP